MRYRLNTYEAHDGHAIVNGRIHGSKWIKQYEVTFKFDTIAERKEFIRKVLAAIDQGRMEQTNEI